MLRLELNLVKFSVQLRELGLSRELEEPQKRLLVGEPSLLLALNQLQPLVPQHYAPSQHPHQFPHDLQDQIFFVEEGLELLLLFLHVARNKLSPLSAQFGKQVGHLRIWPRIGKRPRISYVKRVDQGTRLHNIQILSRNCLFCF